MQETALRQKSVTSVAMKPFDFGDKDKKRLH